MQSIFRASLFFVSALALAVGSPALAKEESKIKTRFVQVTLKAPPFPNQRAVEI